MSDLLLAIDQGTTSTRAIVFDRDLRPCASATRPLTSARPRPGWVEQDPREILDSVVTTVRDAVDAAGGPARIAAAGLDNQGETVVAWDARTGDPLAPAVSWQCKRSAPIVERLRAAGYEPEIRRRTGLRLDPYFSASKMTWLLKEVPAVRQAARLGRLRLGTVDAWLTDRLAGTPSTDPSTASRTQLFNLRERAWDGTLAALFEVPLELLPEIRDSAGKPIVITHPQWGYSLPLDALACDQQAALAGHGCFEPGDVKATFGTGVFVMANAGPRLPDAPLGLLVTVAWALAGRFDYALDGGVFTAGTVIDWLRDGLGIIGDPAESEQLARSVRDDGGVRFLPALAGLGAPWWRSEEHGHISGITAATTRAHIARAALDGIAHRVADILEAMTASFADQPERIRVDGGLSANKYLMQRQADLLGVPLEIAATGESTALGIAGLAALGAGIYSDVKEIAARLAPAVRVEPTISREKRKAARVAWRQFVDSVAAPPTRRERG